MRNKRIILSLLSCLLLIGWLSKPVFAEERNIYIGDLITIEVKSKAMGEEELRKAFEAFEVVDIQKTQEGFAVTVRTFEPGDHKVLIGNQSINISVQSTLENMKRDDIFEGNSVPRSGNMPIKWFIIYVIVLGIFVVSGMLFLLSKLKRRKTKEYNPYENFGRQLDQLLLTTNSCLVDMTAILKNYVEELFDCMIIGKTTDEIMMEIEGIEGTIPHQKSIQSWLKVCDTYKFSGRLVNKEAKDELLQDLKTIGSMMHETSEVKI